MSGYAALLENYLEEDRYANETFSSISESLDSLTAFVNEGVNFEMTISLTEAEDGIADKEKKVSATIKKGIENLIKKLEAFATKIAEATKKFIAKAKVTIAQCGNEALKKMIGSNKYVIGKDIKVRVMKVDSVEGDKVAASVYKAIDEANNKISKQIMEVNHAITAGEAVEVTRDNGIIETLATKVENSDASTTRMLSSADKMTVKKAYQEYVGCYLDVVKSNLSNIEGQAKESQKYCKDIVSALKKTEMGKELNAESIAAVNAISSDVMKLTTYALNYSMSVLTIATKNGAKIALGAVDATGKAAVAATKNAVEEGKKKAGEVAGKVKSVVKKDKAEAAEADA